MLHLTFVNNSGAAKYVTGLVKAQAQAGSETILICPPDFEFLDEVRRVGVVVHSIVPVIRRSDPARLILDNLIQSLVTASRISHLRRSDRFVHGNFAGETFFSMIAAAALRLRGFRLIHTAHDVLPHNWLFPKGLRWAERLALFVLYRIPDRLIVLHSGAAEELSREFGIPRDRIDVIPHGTFQLGEGPAPMPKGSEVTALVFGSLRRNKGIDLAIEAIQRLRAEGIPIRLRIAGRAHRKDMPFWEECKARIASQSDGIDVREHFVAEDEIPLELQRTHFMLLPYCDFGSQSGVASLALSNGRCIVATRAGGLRDLVSPQTGIAIEQASVADVANALRRAVKLGVGGLTELGLSAYTTFTRKYSWASIAAQHFRVYQETLQHPQAVRYGTSVANRRPIDGPEPPNNL